MDNNPHGASESHYLIRYIAPPSKLDCYPYGTICFVHKNDDGTEFDIYIQKSFDTEIPEWTSASDLLSDAFKPYVKDPQFIKNLLSLIEKRSRVQDIMANLK